MPSGSVAFHDSSILISRGPQAWVSAARRTGDVSIRLELRAARSNQSGPARVSSETAGGTGSSFWSGEDA